MRNNSLVYLALAVIFGLFGLFFHLQSNYKPKEKCSQVKIRGQDNLGDIKMVYNCKKGVAQYVSLADFEKAQNFCTCEKEELPGKYDCFVIQDHKIGSNIVLVKWKNGKIEILTIVEAEEKNHCCPVIKRI